MERGILWNEEGRKGEGRVRKAVFLGGGRGEGRGQHNPPKYSITFFCDIS